MNDIEWVPYGQQDLPENGPCPRCGRLGARYREMDPQTENYKIICPCGENIVPKDQLEDYLDSHAQCKADGEPCCRLTPIDNPLPLCYLK